MPTYEYRCKSCGQHLEVVQAFTDDPLTECEACGGELRKVFGSVGISFKGSGFYRTDSRGSGGTSSTAAAKGDSASSPDSSSSSDSSSSGDSGSASGSSGSSGSSSDSGSASGSSTAKTA